MVGNNAWQSQTKQWIKLNYPNLNEDQFRITSADTIDYNCVAWAAEDTDKWWWPDPMYENYWPVNCPREETLLSFIKAFQQLAYEVCQEPNLEASFQKIAIYVLNSKPTHVARQLSNGKWTSKLGQYEDVEHDTLEGLEGEKYGKVAVLLKKNIHR